MSVHRRATCAAIARPHAPLRRAFRALAAVTFAAAAAGCWTVPPPAPVAGPDPADPKARAAGVTYRSSVEPYVSARPVGPTPWRERNEQVAPKAKQ